MIKIKELVTKLGASSGAIMMVDTSAQLLRCAAHYNMPKEWVEITNPLDRTTLTGRVYCDQQPIIANSLNKKLLGYPIASVVFMPIKRGRAVIGAIEIITDDQDRQFTDQDLEILKKAAPGLAKAWG